MDHTAPLRPPVPSGLPLDVTTRGLRGTAHVVGVQWTWDTTWAARTDSAHHDRRGGGATADAKG